MVLVLLVRQVPIVMVLVCLKYPLPIGAMQKSVCICIGFECARLVHVVFEGL